MALYVLFFVVSACLSLTHLDQTAFWDDESQVAIIAQNYLHTGKATGWDGRNLFGYHNGVLLDNDLNSINPPLDYLVTAASFRLFGVSTWTARLPFVLCGLASLFVLFLLLKQEFGQGSAISLSVFGLFSLSVVFLLNIRNCRYYALSLLFTLLTYYAYRRTLKDPRPAFFVVLGVAAVLLFFSNFLLCLSFLTALILVHFRLHWAEVRNIHWWKNVAVAGVIFLLGTVPYAIRHRIWERQDFASSGPWYLIKPLEIFLHFLKIYQMGALPWVAVVGLFLFYVRQPKNHPVRQITIEWALLVAAYAISLALLLPRATSPIRYLIPVFPFLIGLTGIFVGTIHARSRPLAATLFLVLLTCNLLAITPVNMSFRWSLPAYIREVTHPYPTANAIVSDFLRKNAGQDDLVAATPEFMNYPLMFYTGDKVRFCGMLEEQHELPPEATDKLPSFVFQDQAYPDWIISFGAVRNHYGDNPDPAGMIDYYSRPHIVDGKPFHYSYHFVKTLDVYWDSTNRPELPWHHFGPLTDFDRRTSAVYVFKRDK